MKRTDPSRSPGAERVAGLALIALLGAAGPASAQDYPSGEAAYAARDWEAAETIWRAQAEAGAPLAMLGLGNLLDFGLLGDRDPEAAFEQYLAAAKAGLAEAAFNVAVMYDSADGTDRDLRAAAAWYSFAAIDGHARARFNLGQMFAQGAGIPENAALADYWLERAAGSIPAATALREDLRPQVDGDLAAPDLLAAEIISSADGTEARMAWAPRTGPGDASYRVELILVGPELLLPLAGERTAGSAIAIPLDDGGADFAWRVLQMAADDSGYASSVWQSASGETLDPAPIGAVRFEFNADDRRAEGFAQRIGGAMARGGALVSYAETDDPVPQSAVSFHYAQDSALASDVSDFLPGSDTISATRIDAPGLTPGEIRVSLSFEQDDG